jgi:hypothetical protein
MPDFLTIDEYEARAGRTFTGVKRAQIEAFLTDASAIVRRVAQPHLDDADAETVPRQIKPIIFNMVTRATTNPRGLKSERIGDYAYDTHGPGSVSIYTTAEEDRLILEAVDETIIGHITLEGDMPERLLLEADIAFPVDKGEFD